MKGPIDYSMIDPGFDHRLKGVNSPYMADYFGLWMIHGDVFSKMVNQINGMNLNLHLQSTEVASRVASRDHRLYEVDRDGIATFQIAGPMMKAVPSMAEGSSYLRLRQQISSARRDPEVTGGLLMMDTPGGTVKGNEDLVTEVSKFAADKPIFAFTEDMTASAGVSIASQATKRYANNATAMYGAMGTYAVIQDVSGMADKLGIKVHVVKAGEHKGDGTPGTEITDEQLQEMQRVVNTLNENYLGLIARGLGRSVDSLRELADGRVIMASDATEAGLINGVQSLDQTIQELREMVSRKTQTSVSNHRSDSTMADKTPATLKELKSTFPNSTAEWRETQLEAGNDISQAAISYAQHVETQAAAAAEQHKQELEEAKAAKPPVATGHQPLTNSSVNDGSDIDSGDAVQDFHAAVNARLPKGRSATYNERQAAIAFVARTNPGLHQAYIAAGNHSTRAKRLLQEKYETTPAA